MWHPANRKQRNFPPGATGRQQGARMRRRNPGARAPQAGRPAPPSFSAAGAAIRSIVLLVPLQHDFWWNSARVNLWDHTVTLNF